MFSRIFKDACKNIKEQNYPKGLVSDFSAVARDLDKLCKSAMYISNIYDDEKNMEIIQLILIFPNGLSEMIIPAPVWELLWVMIKITH
jgi:hypothetical protein